MNCQHIKCTEDADVWAWDGARWRRLCGRHNAALVSRLDLGLYRASWDHPLDGDPPPPPPDAAPALMVAPTVQATGPEPASPPQEPPCSPSTSAPSAPSSPAGACPGPDGAPSSSASTEATVAPRRPRSLPALVLRAAPDADRSLCRIEGCAGRPVSRGLCVSCAGRARHAGRLEAVARAPTPRIESGKASGRARAATAPTSCRMPECKGAPVSHGWCHMHHGRTRTLKVNAATITPDALVRAWGDYLRAKHPELQAPTGHGAEGTMRAGLRDLLGHPITSTDAELLDAAREVKAERDRADAELAALGDLLTERGSASDDLPLLERARAVLDQRDSHLRHRDACLVELADVGEEIARLRIAYGLPDRTTDVEVVAEATIRARIRPIAPRPDADLVSDLLDACDGANPNALRALRRALGLPAHPNHRSAS